MVKDKNGGRLTMETIDLRDYFGRLLKNWLIIALCCVIGISFAFIYSEFLTRKYMKVYN